MARHLSSRSWKLSSKRSTSCTDVPILFRKSGTPRPLTTSFSALWPLLSSSYPPSPNDPPAYRPERQDEPLHDHQGRREEMRQGAIGSPSNNDSRCVPQRCQPIGEREPTFCTARLTTEGVLCT